MLARRAFVVLLLTASPTAGGALLARHGAVLASAPRCCSPAALAKPKAKRKPKAAAAAFDLKSSMEHAMRAFRSVRPEGAALSEAVRPLSRDVYVRVEDGKFFYFVGKTVALECTAEESAVLQKRIILEHAKLLHQALKDADQMKRPLQLWLAPANTEVAVAQRKQTLSPVDGVRISPELRALAMGDEPPCGFEPDVFDPGNPGGFRVALPEDGVPAPGSEFEVSFVAPGGEELRELAEGQKRVVTVGGEA